MTKHIPSPHISKLPPAHQHGLHRGIYLENTYPWRRAVTFLLLVFPIWWLLLTLGMWLLYKQGPPFLTALAYTGLTLPVLFVFHYVYHVFFAKGPKLSIRDESLHIDHQHERWTLYLPHPYTASILYRDTHEDALLVLQDPIGVTRYIYGRYRMEHALPPHSIPTAELGFSLAEWSIDVIGAPMFPDKDIEHLPFLMGHLLHTEGYHPFPRFLPLTHTAQRLRLDATFMLWSQQGEFQRKFSFPFCHVQPFRLTRGTQHQLYLHIESLSTHQETDEDILPPALWIAVEWPVSLSCQTCSPLPQAPPPAQTIHLPWIDALFLAQYLERRGVFQAGMAFFAPALGRRHQEDLR